jgi:hypothetical protein
MFCVGLTYVVASCDVTLPFVHCTAEQGRRFVPLTVNMNGADPAVAPVCEMEIFDGAGGEDAEIVKAIAAERIPELDTSILTVPGEAMYAAGIVAVSCVELTKVVASADVTAGDCVVHSTTEAFTKFVPATVSVTPGGLQDGVVFGEVEADDVMEEIEGDTIVKLNLEEAADPGLIRSMFALPGFARSAAGTMATTAAGVLVAATAGTYVVGSVLVTLLPFTH